MIVAKISACALNKMHRIMSSAHDVQYTEFATGREMRFQIVE
jgi:hypothetical protein